MSHPRRDYSSGELDESTAGTEPHELFDTWLSVARDDERIDEAYAMTVATVGSDGRPSARIVLLREHRQGQFIFFTNYESRKGCELATNPQIALVFYWGPLERQIRIEGTVEKLDPEASDEYFASRPVKSQLAAIASHQSQVNRGRSDLERRFEEVSAGERESILRPANWGGYSVRPSSFEFWQGRRSRLHDRIVFDKNDSKWEVTRLDP